MTVMTVDVSGCRFGRVNALREVRLSIAAGECVALVGANGAGKSTLLRLLQGLVPPISGQVDRRAGLKVASVFQKPFVLRTTVLRNVAIAAWFAGASWADAKVRAAHALEQVGLADLLNRQAWALSGGQQQLLGLARALVVDADVLLLDEATASLAPHVRRTVQSVIAACVRRGTTVVFASHSVPEVQLLARRVVLLVSGQIAYDGPCDAFFEWGQHGAAAMFMEGN